MTGPHDNRRYDNLTLKVERDDLAERVRHCEEVLWTLWRRGDLDTEYLQSFGESGAWVAEKLERAASGG